MSQQRLAPELLQWLFRVIQPEYVEPRITYQDVAITIQRFPSLKPRTKVFTHESGDSKLLLSLYGSIPCTIGGVTYKIPVELWVPHEYPFIPPFVYVVPTEKMSLQPGNHVDSSGKCYLPYLSNWNQSLDTNTNHSTIVKLCESLSQIFSLEPPVFAKPATVILPSKSGLGNSGSSTVNSSPAPMLPPKQKEFDHSETTSPPPLPPLPEELRTRTIMSPTFAEMNKDSRRTTNMIYEQSFEQPNIMDDEAQVAVQDDSDRIKLLSQIENLLALIYTNEVGVEISSYSSDINKIKYSISKFDKIFEYEFNRLNNINHQAEENTKILDHTIKQAHDVISKAQSYKELNVDELICAETVVYNQLYNLVAEDLAISDTVYALNKAHDHGNIPLDIFTKHVRSLAREQFLKRALILKISQLANLNTFNE